MRTMTAAVLALLLAGLLSACGAAGGGPKPTATFGPAVQTRLAESQRPAATSTPTAEAAAQVATATPTPRPETPTPRPTAPDLAEPEPDPATETLLLALISLDDLPEGWWADEATVDDGNASGWTGDDDMFMQPRQEDACGYGYADPTLAAVSAYFGSDDDEILVLQQAEFYANDQSANLLLSQVFAAVARCPEFEETYGDGMVSTTRFDLLEGPQIGEQSGTIQITSSDDEFDYAVVITGFRVGRVVSFVFQFGSLADLGPAEGWELHRLAARAAEKISALRETFDALDTPTENVV